ncbi:MAG: TIGR02757 family protein [Helicobacter sp.]|nr:TIGR02757 family protein [Helicobacter sp.]
MQDLGALLESHYKFRNENEDFSSPDPLKIAKEYKNHELADLICLFCALFAYGSAAQIVKFLQKIENLTSHFNDLKNPSKIAKTTFPKYRFNTENDVKQMLLALSNLAKTPDLLKITALNAYQNAKSTKNTKGAKIIKAIYAMQDLLYENLPQNDKNASFGLTHLISKRGSTSALKRWNMFLRWMIRKDNLDLGLWPEFSTSDLLLPLDTHTFKICNKLGLLNTKICNLDAVIKASKNLAAFCQADPIKYDFALYRAGQENSV